MLSFTPQGQADLLWVSPVAAFEQGKPIRGGIPVCLPWFGVNRRDPDKPKHGFARTSRWRLEYAQTCADGATQLTLALRQFSRKAHPHFPHCFEALLNITVARELMLQLQVVNRSPTRMPLSWALHSYHPVSDLGSTTVRGLQGTEYLDNTRGLERRTQQQPPRFDGEFDRVYLSVPGEQSISGHPEIRIRGQNAPTAIVWNPGPEIALSLPDLGHNAHRKFICVERGAAFDDEPLVAPGATLHTRVTIAAGTEGPSG